MHRNSEWLGGMGIADVLRLSAHTTVAQMLERDDFANRYREGRPISLTEFLYPLLQGWDSVVVEADVELGGTDQLFNLMVGRDLMRDSGQEPQVALTTPILTGLDGHDKMSKSLGNHIGVSMEPFEMYSRVMSMPDTIMKEWYTLLTSLPIDEIERLCDGQKTHPKSAKDRLAREVVKGYHPDKADAAAQEWDSKFSKGDVPKEMPDLEVPAEIGVVDLIVLTKIPPSRGEAKRLIEQGGVELDGRKITDLKGLIQAKGGEVLRVGKKQKYFKLKRA